MPSSPAPDLAPPEPRRGREARRAARAQRGFASIPYITRAIPTTEILGEEGLALIERNADTLLQEIGIEFRDYPGALERFKAAGCDVKGERDLTSGGEPRSFDRLDDDGVAARCDSVSAQQLRDGFVPT